MEVKFECVKPDLGLKQTPIFDVSPIKNRFLTMNDKINVIGHFQNIQNSLNFSLSKPDVELPSTDGLHFIQGTTDNDYIAFYSKNGEIEIHDLSRKQKLFPKIKKEGIKKIANGSKLNFYILQNDTLYQYKQIFQKCDKLIEKVDAFTTISIPQYSKDDSDIDINNNLFILYITNQYQIKKHIVQQFDDEEGDSVIYELPQKERNIIDMFTLASHSIAMLCEEDNKVCLYCYQIPKNNKQESNTTDNPQQKDAAFLPLYEHNIDAKYSLFSHNKLPVFFIGSSESPNIMVLNFNCKTNQINLLTQIQIPNNKNVEFYGSRSIVVIESEHLFIHDTQGFVSYWNFKCPALKSNKAVQPIISKHFSYVIPEDVYMEAQEKPKQEVQEIQESKIDIINKDPYKWYESNIIKRMNDLRTEIKNRIKEMELNK